MVGVGSGGDPNLLGVTVPLTDSAVRNAKPRERAYKLSDERGMFLLVQPTGGKWWRLKYRIDGREKSLSLGTYPDTPLKKARERRDDARRLIADGIDPSAERAARRQQRAHTFDAIAREWYATKAPTWAPSNAEAVLNRMERWCLPVLGRRPIASISAADVLDVLRRIEQSGAIETAHRVRNYCSQIFRFAIASGRAERDVAADLKGALRSPTKRHYAAITDPTQLGALLRAIDGFEGSFVVRCALRITPYVFVRPGELRQMEWADVDLERGQWRIPGSRMKTGSDHIVPLAQQVRAVLSDLRDLTGEGRFAFPSNRTRVRAMSENTLNAALRRLGYTTEEVTAHGFRATARTLLDEELGERPDFIEHQLAHAVRDPNGRAYNRTAYLEERVRMMQRWADYLDSLRGDSLTQSQ